MSAAASKLAMTAGLVAPALGVEPGSVFDIAPRTRRTAPETRARELTIYLAHTSAAQSLRMLAEALWQDRRDIRRIVQRIEDARDDADFDALTSRLEAAFGALGHAH